MLGKIISVAGFMALSMGAYASSITVDAVNDDFFVNFNGVVNENPQPGLTASADFTVDSISADRKLWTFTVELEAGPAAAPITDYRVTVLGFDTNPNIIVPDSDVSGGSFDTVSSGNMPQAGSIEVCLTNVNCAGGGPGGVQLGSSLSLVVILAFADAVNALTLDNFAVRYQSIVGSPYGTSGTGFGTVVPIPAALWMFLSALFGLVAMRRLRHRGESDKDAASADGVPQPA